MQNQKRVNELPADPTPEQVAAASARRAGELRPLDTELPAEPTPEQVDAALTRRAGELAAVLTSHADAADVVAAALDENAEAVRSAADAINDRVARFYAADPWFVTLSASVADLRTIAATLETAAGMLREWCRRPVPDRPLPIRTRTVRRGPGGQLVIIDHVPLHERVTL